MDTTNMIAGIVTAAATLGLFVLGIFGLTGWRSQSNWRESHDLAKRLLHSVYKVRDIVHVARNPFISPGEADDPTGDDWERNAYSKRWSRVTAAQVKLDAAMTEADVLWGKETPLDEAETELRQQIGKLFLAIKHFLNNDGPNEGLFTEADRAILYSTSVYNGGTLDAYDTELDRIIGEYEVYLEQYLGRKK
jgi:hypothetical protein